METIPSRVTVTLAVILLLAASFTTLVPNAYGQEKKDNSGTNPTNFTYDFRLIMEVQSLPGENSSTRTTFAYSAPLSQKVAARVRGYLVDVSLGSGASAATTTGLGDMDARLLWIPRVTRKGAIALGLEASFPTASQPLLGTGKTTLGPQAFLVFFNVPGPGMLFAPAYQHKFSIGGDGDRVDINQSLIDLYVVWLASNKKHWAILDPQIVIDHENELEFAVIESEVGQMMFGATSSYIRPGVGIGHDRPLDWNIEFGFKVIWK